MLSAQGNEPFEVQSYKGIQAPISPYAGLAKLLQTYIGAKQSADIEKKRGEVGKISGEEFTNFMKNYEGTPEFTRMNPVTAAESQPAALTAPSTALRPAPEMLSRPFVAAGTPPQKMAQALQSSMATQTQAPQAKPVYGNAAPNIPEATVVTPGHVNTPQEKMAMLMQGMTSGNPYMEKFAPAMYDEARQEEKSNKVFKAIDLAEQNGADPKIMAAFRAANDPNGAVSYLAERGLKKEDAEAAVFAYRIKAADTAEERALDRASREGIAAEGRADRAEGRAQGRSPHRRDPAEPRHRDQGRHHDEADRAQHRHPDQAK
jgi:hypothetical protein